MHIGVVGAVGMQVGREEELQGGRIQGEGVLATIRRVVLPGG